MFTFLRICDFAIIESLELELGPGLTVLSGETGAGKSIILAAVNLLLGQRAASDLIRQGRDQAVVEAAFDIDGLPALRQALETAGVSGEDGEVVVRRVVNRSGRNRVQVGGALSTLGLLADIGPSLVSISGQHASQVLLNQEQHLLLLDDYAGLAELRGGVRDAVEAVRALDAEIAEVRASLAQREARREELEHQVAELSTAGLDPAEDAALKAERDLLGNAEQIASLAENAYEGLYDAEGSALEVLGRVKALTTELKMLDPRAAALADGLEGAFFQMEDAAAELRAYKSGLVFDPGRLDWVEGRLLDIQRITRKYGGDVASALEFLAEAEAELAALGSGDQRLKDLNARRAQALQQALGLARDLSARRRREAAELGRAVAGQLHELSMNGCEFEVRLSPATGAALDTEAGPLSSRGLEQAEFFIAPNPGEGMRRLSRIASGGELSRVLLAIREITARGKSAPTLIFDEVDQGIGGVTGNVVGAKLASLSRSFQVVCITHLPQIAAWADHHLAVVKQTEQGRTQTALKPLNGEERVAELARMLGGDAASEQAAEHARQMLAAAQAQKEGRAGN